MADRSLPGAVTTRRLCLDALWAEDVDALHELGRDTDVARMLASVKPGWSREDAQAWLAPRIGMSSNGFSRAIRLKDGPLIGSVGAGGDPVDLGYFIGKAYWRQGYASEALEAFLPLFFEAFPSLQDMRAEVFEDNPVSAHVLMKLGFQKVGPGSCQSVARLEPSPNWLYRLERSQVKVTT